MFNMVFVLNPPILEYPLRTKEMYDHVVKKFGRALKWEQARLNYIWTESELIQSIESKHFSKRSPSSALYSELLARSSLARAISSVYTSISSNRIASVTLGPGISISLQIPPITSTSVLPSATDPPAQPGLWLTTADEPPSATSDIDANIPPSGSFHLAKHFTLLLLDSPQKILKDISAAGGPLAAPLSNFINAFTPTKSFHKISLASSIPIAEIQVLAQHLIYWRRAIAIPPLHQRDTYIVSPNADMRKLKDACKTYEATFPTLPGLAKMLSALSGTPRPYSTLIPTPDHKEAYITLLGWMLRGGWVTQLRTFAHVRVDPEVKKEVREKERQEKLDGRRRDATTKETNHDDEGIAPLKRPSVVSRPSSGDLRRRNDIEERMASLILHPHRASPLESKYLDHIRDNLLTGKNSSADLSDEDKEDLKKHWQAFTKYFNGMEALEKIPVREALKRKVVWEIMGKMGLSTLDAGTGESAGQGKILVGVRHW